MAILLATVSAPFSYHTGTCTGFRFAHNLRLRRLPLTAFSAFHRRGFAASPTLPAGVSAGESGKTCHALTRAPITPSLSGSDPQRGLGTAAPALAAQAAEGALPPSPEAAAPSPNPLTSKAAEQRPMAYQSDARSNEGLVENLRANRMFKDRRVYDVMLKVCLLVDASGYLYT